ncbi:MAG: hypothetical protein J6V64_04445 [Burkholderiaceae bacterium]|nr:hypothetical protein [Burkholderiaceae bacterium]
MNEIYLGHWIHTPLHCPFCGTRLDAEQLKAGVAPCSHVLLSFEDGQFQFVSDEGVLLAHKLFQLNNVDLDIPAIGREELVFKNRILTAKGLLSPRDAVKQITVKLDNDWIRYVHFRCDAGSDFGEVIFVADEKK